MLIQGAFHKLWLRTLEILEIFTVTRNEPGPKVIKLFYARLSTKFQLLIKAKILTNEEVSCSKSLRCYIYHANKC